MRPTRSAILMLSSLLALSAAAPALAQSSRTWFALDTQPPGTPAQLVFDAAGSDANMTRGTLTISGFWLVSKTAPDGTPYNDVQVPGLTNLSQLGAPRLPAVQMDVGILTGASMVTLEQASGPAVYFHGVHVWPEPVEAQFHEGSPEVFTRDDAIYRAQEFWPPSVSTWPKSPTTFSGLLEYSSVVLNPFRWNPGVDDMEVHPRYDFALAHRGTLTPLDGLTKPQSRYLGNAVFNGPALVGSLTADPVRYAGEFLFVTPLIYLSDIGPLILQKKSRGFGTSVLLTEQIGYGCASTLAAIKAWYHSTSPKADHFCILVGSDDDIPLCGSPPIPGFSTGVPSDDPYGNPDTPGSLDKEILVGRLPVRSHSDVLYDVARLLGYEDSPAFPSRFSHVLLAAHEAAIGATPIQSWQEDVRTAPYAVPPIFETQYGATPGVDDVSLSAAIDAGQGLVCYLGHGDSFEWWQWDLPHEDYAGSNVAGLTNGPNCPVVWSFACQTNDLSVLVNTCFGESWMRQKHHGAVSFYGGTRSVYVSPTVDLDKAMFEELYNKSNVIQGFTILAGEKRMEQLHNLGDAWKYLLLGDPQMSIRRIEPIHLRASGPSIVLQSCDTGMCPAFHLNVSDANGRPLAGAKVGIWKAAAASANAPGLSAALASGPDEVLDDRYTDANGDAFIPVPPLTDGTLYYSVEMDEGEAMSGTAAIVNGNVGVPPSETAASHLVAQPSLLRTTTRFEFGGALTARARVEVFDVLGRRVRTLRVETGARDVAWAGDDDAGRRLAAGLYLARLQGGREIGHCRVVVP
jgi:hypothetical protein